ncbi:MAG: polynucleotide adenylyltransferase PcnB [Deltaproteobacteria bacterium]|nr:polynucleotide adenylyltransferase PcnB [Deltaproteobacteria bacterium]
MSNSANPNALTSTAPQPDEPMSFPPPPDVCVSLRVERRPFPADAIDPDAAKVLHRLRRFEFESYLVGGCVRDLLLGRRPKDFDIVTSARPNEMRRIFGNCRLIGRRFRLAHLLFKDRKIIEVATFRRGATAEDDVSEKHAAENLFGGPLDDAIRRDFTINALTYDLHRGEIRDYVGGLVDVERRELRTIGDPDRRLVEDPVRIIRAVKFAVRLGLTIDPLLWDAMKRHAPLVARCAMPRLAEEIFKLLRSGSAAAALRMVHEIGALAPLMAGLDRAILDAPDPGAFFALLGKTDERIRGGLPISDPVLLSALLHPACRVALAEDGDVAKNLETTLRPLVEPMRFTKRHMALVRQILLAQRRLAAGAKGRHVRRILDRDYAFEAIEFLSLCPDGPGDERLASQWCEAAAARAGRPAAKDPEPDESPKAAPSGRRRRRRRRPGHPPQGEGV